VAHLVNSRPRRGPDRFVHLSISAPEASSIEYLPARYRNRRGILGDRAAGPVAGILLRARRVEVDLERAVARTPADFLDEVVKDLALESWDEHLPKRREASERLRELGRNSGRIGRDPGRVR